MKFETFKPVEQLRQFVNHFAISENASPQEYKVLPSPGLVIGFQYRGKLATVQDDTLHHLASAGITGISDSYKVFINTSSTGTVLVYFTPTGFAHFASQPVNELFNESISLTEIFHSSSVAEVEDKLQGAAGDKQRVRVVESFLLSQLKDIETDNLIVRAVQLIFNSRGTIKIKELHEQLFISQSPFEKRFRKVVGTTPKKFASIIRFNAVINTLRTSKSLTELCYENGFFDQAHFIRDFRQFTGDTPEKFRRFL